jgi:hypothetical protein
MMDRLEYLVRADGLVVMEVLMTMGASALDSQLEGW